MRRHHRFFALPAPEDRFQVFGLTVAFFVWFVALYSSASFLSGHVPWRLHVSFAFERHIPFMPQASALYLSMDVLVALAPFVLRDLRSILPLFGALCAQTAIAAVCFVALPVETDFAARHVTGSSALSFHIADLLNLERNFLPSLHVGFAVTAALAYAPRAPILGKVGLGLWAFGIAIATLLIHEHHLIDVVAGAALAWLCFRTVGAYVRRPAVVEAVDIELICLRSLAAFSRRHVRYLLIGLALLRVSFPHYRRKRVLRTGFCFLQTVDDLLDGDRTCDQEPLELVRALNGAIETSKFGNDELSRLARAFSSDLRAVGGQAAVDEAIALMHVMERDRTRVLARELLSASELRSHHHLTFHYSIDLLLIAASAELRAQDVPELIDALGWCSVMRDLEDDLQHGLINVPKEVVHQALEQDVAIDTPAFLAASAVRSWMREELQRVLPLLDRSDTRLVELGNRRGVQVLALFSRSIRRYAERRIPRKLAAFDSLRAKETQGSSEGSVVA